MVESLTVGDEEKARAAAWFETLRDQICAAFEALEDALESGPHAEMPPARFERKATRRGADGGEDGGGGVMSVMRGRVFEKVGVNISTVHGRLDSRAQGSLTARKAIPGLAEDPRFWASGISLVAHMRSPLTPAVHMNTRMFWTPTAWWFGGGSDLNPMIEDAADTADFHAALKRACDAHDADYHPKFKAWADEYFLIRHWNEPRGAGGSSTTTSAPATGRRTSPLPKPSGGRSSRSFRRSPRGTCTTAGPRRSARSSWSSADAMPSSTCSTTAARASGWRPATIPRRC